MPIRFLNVHGLSDVAHGLIVAALIILFLYLAGEIVEPLVIAALLSFILAPVMRGLRGFGIPRAVSAVLSVTVMIGVISVIGTTLLFELSQLADELPRYESNLREKVQLLHGSPLTSGALEHVTGTLRDLQNELSRGENSGQPNEPKPVPVEVRPPEPRGLEAIGNLVRPLLAPLATGALVVLFLLFILLQREDLRDRLLRLAGTADLHRSTAALDDAGERLARFFLMQTLLNAGFGIFITGGLYFIGVPNAVLWGILSGLLRFVPFIGSLIAAFFPIAIAAAVDPGWSTAVMAAALFLVAEPVTGQIIEPLVYGQHTGLSPVAIVVSTLFWTLLWGPIGLLLATPLTVCLVVLGKHIEGLNFIDVLLGDEPALEPEERFYQRLLASDATEASDQAEEQLKEQALSAYYDAIPMKALMLAQGDAAQRKLSFEKQEDIRDTMNEIIGDLRDYSDAAPGADEKEQTAPPSASLERVLCVASRSPLDEAAARLLAHILDKHSIKALVQPFTAIRSAQKVDAPDAQLVCLSYFGAWSKPAHVRYLIRHLRRSLPQAKFLACFWMLADNADKVEEWRAAVGADFVATSLNEARLICARELRAGPSEILAAPPTKRAAKA